MTAGVGRGNRTLPVSPRLAGACDRLPRCHEGTDLPKVSERVSSSSRIPRIPKFRKGSWVVTVILPRPPIDTSDAASFFFAIAFADSVKAQLPQFRGLTTLVEAADDDAMGGSEFEEFELVEEEANWDGEKMPTTTPKLPTTLVLVGRTGNGKSATGNSLLGSRVFKSRASSSAVTSTCELQESTRPDGQHLRVIDTPGLFDPNLPPEFIGKEIMKCLDLAKDGVHALLLVLSVRNRFTDEEIAAVESLQTIFGEKVVNHMVVVFTGGDDLDDDQSLDGFLKEGAPTYLRDFLKKCEDRKVLFDNKTKDKATQMNQTTALLRVIDDMLLKNGGNPYANELFKEAQELAFKSEQERSKSAARAAPGQELQEIKRDLENTYAEQFKQLREMVEDKIRLNAERLEERLSMEQSAREAAEDRARADKTRADAELRALREELQQANREREELSRKIQEQLSSKNCLIL